MSRPFSFFLIFPFFLSLSFRLFCRFLNCILFEGSLGDIIVVPSQRELPFLVMLGLVQVDVNVELMWTVVVLSSLEESRCRGGAKIGDVRLLSALGERC